MRDWPIPVDGPLRYGVTPLMVSRLQRSCKPLSGFAQPVVLRTDNSVLCLRVETEELPDLSVH
jgi:hypothetical protein